MALALFFIGLILVVSGIKGTQSQLATLLASEFTGDNNFWAFIVGIFFLGALGYYPPLRNTSRLLIGLVLVVLVLSNGGFWQKLTAAIGNPVSAVPTGVDAVPDAVEVKQAAAALGLEKSVVSAGATQDDQDLASGGTNRGDPSSATNSNRGGNGTLSTSSTGNGLGAMFGDLGKTDLGKSLMDDIGGAAMGMIGSALGPVGGALVGGIASGKGVANTVNSVATSAANKATGGMFSGTIGKAIGSITGSLSSGSKASTSSKSSAKK